MSRTRTVHFFLALAAYSSPSILLAMTHPIYADEPSTVLYGEQASAFARLALKGLSKEYPNKLEHVLAGPDDVKGPRVSIRRFTGRTTGIRRCTVTGCSCGCSARFPTCPKRQQIRAVGRPPDGGRTSRPRPTISPAGDKSFERPYGWAWLLKLAEELQRLGRPRRQSMVEKPAAARPTWSSPVTWISSRSRPTRSGPACIQTRRSGSHSPMTMRGSTATRLTWLVESAARAYFGADADARPRGSRAGRTSSRRA